MYIFECSPVAHLPFRGPSVVALMHSPHAQRFQASHRFLSKPSVRPAGGDAMYCMNCYRGLPLGAISVGIPRAKGIPSFHVR
jgi:hypothetical protein